MARPERKPNSSAILPAALLAALAAGLAIISFQLDQPVRERIVAAQGKGWKKSDSARWYGAVSRFGDWPQLMAVGAIGSLIAWRLRNRDWARILLAAMAASTLAGIVANASRATTGRTRPRESPKIEQGWYGPVHNGEILIGNAKYNSFPSGHTATAAGFAGVILFARPLAGVAAMAVAFLIAWSRMALGAHHVSDVVVSTILALVIAWFAWRVALERGDDIARWIAGKLRRRPAT